MVANTTWSNDDLLEDLDKDIEIANLSLVAEEDDDLEDDEPEVNDKHFTYGELLHAFDRVLEYSKNLMTKYNELKSAH